MLNWILFQKWHPLFASPGAKRGWVTCFPLENRWAVEFTLKIVRKEETNTLTRRLHASHFWFENFLGYLMWVSVSWATSCGWVFPGLPHVGECFLGYLMWMSVFWATSCGWVDGRWHIFLSSWDLCGDKGWGSWNVIPYWRLDKRRVNTLAYSSAQGQ